MIGPHKSSRTDATNFGKLDSELFILKIVLRTMFYKYR